MSDQDRLQQMRANLNRDWLYICMIAVAICVGSFVIVAFGAMPVGVAIGVALGCVIVIGAGWPFSLWLARPATR